MTLLDGNKEKKQLLKKKEYSDAIEQMAKDHVKKIMTRPTANAELYDAVEKWANEHGMDVKKMQDDAFKVMNKYHSEAVKEEKTSGKREITDKEIIESYKNTSTEQIQNTLHTTKLFASSDPESARHAKIMEQVLKGRSTSATSRNARYDTSRATKDAVLSGISKRSRDIQNRTQERNKVLGGWAGRRITTIPTKELSTIISKLKAAGFSAESYEEELKKRNKK